MCRNCGEKLLERRQVSKNDLQINDVKAIVHDEGT